jgi:predicted SprT family Zn-dependent metalloprotease
MKDLEQAELFSGRPRRELSEVTLFLNDGTRHKVTVRLTRNRVSMISIEGYFPGPTMIRMHRDFLDAPQDVLDALRTYVRTHRRTAWRVISTYAKNISARVPGEVRKEKLRTEGEVFDLKKISGEVNKEFFSGRAECRIGWGRKGAPRRGRRRRSLRFGAWMKSTRTIRINPLLDDGRVPREFIRYIVFHEMLHSVVPADIKGGRRYDHNVQFRTLERAFPDLERMEKLAGKLLETL